MTVSSGDLHDEIERLEALIDALTEKLENCRKFILSAYVAMSAGGFVLIAMLLGLIPLDLTWMAGAMAALLGGIVVWGSNGSTAQEAREEIAEAEAERALLIGQIELRVIEERPTLH